MSTRRQSGPQNVPKNKQLHSRDRGKTSDYESRTGVTQTPGIGLEASNNQHEAAERHYWERQIQISKWQTWLTGMASAAGLLGLFFVYLGIIHADRATIEANRAWLEIEDFNLNMSSFGEPIKIAAVTENVGKEPAINPIFNQPDFGIRYLSPGPETYNSIQIPVRDLCKTISFANETVIFPAQKYPYERYLTRDNPGYPTNEHFSAVLDGRAVFYWQDCVAYQTFNTRRSSPFCFYLFRSPATGKLQTSHCRYGNSAQ